MKESPEKCEQIAKNDEDEKRESEFPRNLRKSCKFFLYFEQKSKQVRGYLFQYPFAHPRILEFYH